MSAREWGLVPLPLRVWRYRGWCWSCRYDIPERIELIQPCAVGWGYTTPADAADAAREHLAAKHVLAATGEVA